MGMDAGNTDTTPTPTTAAPGQSPHQDKLKKALFGGLGGLGQAMQQQQQPQGQASPIGIPQPQFQDMTAGYGPQKNKFFGGY